MITHSSSRGGAFLTSLFTSIIVSLIVCVLFNFYGPEIIEKYFIQTSEVPSLAGMSLEKARAELAGKQLVISVQGEANDAKAPQGSVLSQNPSAGLKIKKDSSISVVLSSGKTVVPKLLSLSLADAKNKIAESGLTVGEILDTESDQAPAGAVVSSNPEMAKEVPQGSAVLLVVSKGVGLVKVPKIIGRRLPAAKNALASAGFVVGNIKEATSEYYQFGIVIDQNPKDGIKAPKGSAVDITVNVEAKGD